MTKKLLLIATMVVASSLSLDTNEAQAQGWRNYNRGFSNRGFSNRGLNTHVYSYPANRGVVFSNRSYAIQMYTPYSAYSLGYGVPSRYGYGNNFGNSFGYGFPGGNGFPSGNGYWGGYDYRSNFNNYGPSVGNTYSPGLNGYGTYRRYSF